MMIDHTDLASRSMIRVDGIDPLPGEAWADYHDRALAWIETDPSFDPAEVPDSLTRVVVASSCYTGLVMFLAGALLLWPV